MKIRLKFRKHCANARAQFNNVRLFAGKSQKHPEKFGPLSVRMIFKMVSYKLRYVVSVIKFIYLFNVVFKHLSYKLIQFFKRKCCFLSLPFGNVYCIHITYMYCTEHT